MTTLAAPVPDVNQNGQKEKGDRRVKLLTYRDGAGLLRLTVARDTSDYFVQQLASDFGDAFHLYKLPHGSEQVNGFYAVNLSEEGHQCECKGFLFHGYCKHIDALVALRQANQI